MSIMSLSVRGLSAAILVVLLFSCATNARGEDWTEKSGDIGVVAIPVAGYLATFATGDAGGRDAFHKSFMSTFGVTCALKFFIDKPRPANNGHFAFPSAHAAHSFQGAAFIQRRYGWACGIPAYLGAAYVGWSRIEANKHDGYDVAAGAAIGILSSYYFTGRYKGLAVAPVAWPGTYCLAVTGRW